MYFSFKKNLQWTIELALKYLYLYIISFSLDHSFILQRYLRQENVSGLVYYNSYFPAAEGTWFDLRNHYYPLFSLSFYVILQFRSNVSNAYPLVIGNEVIDAYCHMTMAETGNETCGYGGWTLVMKINGNKVSFQSFRGRGSLAVYSWVN